MCFSEQKRRLKRAGKADFCRGYFAEKEGKTGLNLSRNRAQKPLENQLKNREFLERMILELYPDFKKGIISAEEYMSLKNDCNNKLAKVDEDIKLTKEKIEEQENGMENNSFVESFKKLGNIEKLTRALVVDLIEEILVHEDSRITVRLKCKDAFEQATEYIKINNDTVKTA